MGKFSLCNKFSINLESMSKMRTSVLSTPRKHMTESLEESCCVLREYGVDGRLLLLAGCEKSLCSYSETCVPVVDVESQPFTVDIELR